MDSVVVVVVVISKHCSCLAASASASTNKRTTTNECPEWALGINLEIEPPLPHTNIAENIANLIGFSWWKASYLHMSKVNPFHLPPDSPVGTKFPFIMKLCFSSSKSMNGTWTTEGGIEKMNGDN